MQSSTSKPKQDGIYKEARQAATKQAAPAIAARRLARSLKGRLADFCKNANPTDRHLLLEVLTEWEMNDPWREFSLASAFHAQIGHCGELIVVRDYEQGYAVRRFAGELQRAAASGKHLRVDGNGWTVWSDPNKKAAG